WKGFCCRGPSLTRMETRGYNEPVRGSRRSGGMADAGDLKSLGQTPCGFESRLRHHSLHSRSAVFQTRWHRPEACPLAAAPLRPKSWRESYTEHKEIVAPPHCNHHGTVFGGHIMALIDKVAGVVAMEHCGSPSVVTASMDRVNFFRPVKQGQMLHLQARATYTGRSSMDIYVKVFGKDLSHPRGEPWLTCEAYTTFVLVDRDGRPVRAVPHLLLETEEDHRLYQEALARREARLAQRK